MSDETTRCKVLCVKVSKRSCSGWYTDPAIQPKPEFIFDAEFQAVTGGGNDQENKRFFASTPTLNLTVCAINGDRFIPGREYYLDFLLVPKVAPATT